MRAYESMGRGLLFKWILHVTDLTLCFFAIAPSGFRTRQLREIEIFPVLLLLVLCSPPPPLSLASLTILTFSPTSSLLLPPSPPPPPCCCCSSSCSSCSASSFFPFSSSSSSVKLLSLNWFSSGRQGRVEGRHDRFLFHYFTINYILSSGNLTGHY